jgi:transposase-like protein
MTITTMSRRRFTAQQKAEAVALCLSEGLSCAAVAQRLGLPNSSLAKCCVSPGSSADQLRQSLLR